jgi:hypothetical protein
MSARCVLALTLSSTLGYAQDFRREIDVTATLLYVWQRLRLPYSIAFDCSIRPF